MSLLMSLWYDMLGQAGRAGEERRDEKDLPADALPQESEAAVTGSRPTGPPGSYAG